MAEKSQSIAKNPALLSQQPLPLSLSQVFQKNFFFKIVVEYNVKFTMLTIFICTNSVAFSTFTMLCNYHQYPILELSYHLKQKLFKFIKNISDCHSPYHTQKNPKIFHWAFRLLLNKDEFQHSRPSMTWPQLA